MRAILAGFALTTFFVTPTLADYYIVQEPTTKRCRIVEERPAPGVGVVIGGIGFGVRTEAETRMRTECRERRRPAAMSLLRSVNVARRDDVRRSRWIRMAWLPSGGTRRASARRAPRDARQSDTDRKMPRHEQRG